MLIDRYQISPRHAARLTYRRPFPVPLTVPPGGREKEKKKRYTQSTSITERCKLSHLSTNLSCVQRGFLQFHQQTRAFYHPSRPLSVCRLPPPFQPPPALPPSLLQCPLSPPSDTRISPTLIASPLMRPCACVQHMRKTFFVQVLTGSNVFFSSSSFNGPTYLPHT